MDKDESAVFDMFREILSLAVARSWYDARLDEAVEVYRLTQIPSWRVMKEGS